MRWWCVLFAVACGGEGPTEATRKLEQAWQGTWVLPWSYDILEVKGRDATYISSSGLRDVKGTFEIIAPCAAKVASDDYSPAISFAYTDRLYARAAGIRVGGTWYACPFSEVVVEHTGKTCTVKNAKKVRCELTATHLDVAYDLGPLGIKEHRLAIHGDVLWDKFEPEPPYLATSLDDAKQHARDRNLSAEPVSGLRLVELKGCVSCHTTDGTPKIGPSLKGVWGTQVTLADGTSVVYDEAYVRESVRTPNAKVRKDYPPTCVAYDDKVLSDAELGRVVEYIQSLR